MSTLADIQAKVDVALVQISNRDFDGVQRVGWREIRRAINEYQGLSRQGKNHLATLIHGRLDALGLQARGQALRINVAELTEQVLRHPADPGSQESIPDWFPW